MSITIFCCLLFATIMVCNAIRICCDEGMIFSYVYDWAKRRKMWIFKPLLTCIECMSPYYSLIIYFIAERKFHVEFDWLIFGLLACSSMMINGLVRSFYIKLNG